MHQDKNKTTLAIILTVLALTVVLAVAWQLSQKTPYEPGTTAEAASVILDGNAGE